MFLLCPRHLNRCLVPRMLTSDGKFDTTVKNVRLIVSLRGNRYVTANPQQECNWCTTEVLYNVETHELSYPALATLAYFVTSIYAIGVPTLFFFIMHSHRHVLRYAKFSNDYGFLTSKTSEKYYWCANRPSRY